VEAVAERVEAELSRSAWDTSALDYATGDRSTVSTRALGQDVGAAAEVAAFALKLAGKRRQARRGGRFATVVMRFALAACIALASVAAACDKPDASPEETQVALSVLPQVSSTMATINASPRASPAVFTDMLLLDAGSDARPWATLLPKDGNAPVLVDRVGAGLNNVGDTYRLTAQPIVVGTRDGTSQFLDPLQPAETTSGTDTSATTSRDQILQRWGEDERYLAATRAIAGQPTVLDAAYNAAAAVSAGGTHTYTDGVVLRVDPDNPVLQVIDRSLLESGRPTRAEDVVNVAIRPSEKSLYEPGQVVNLRDVVMTSQNTDVNGQPATVYVANAALDGARVEPTSSVDLQKLLQPRLQRVDQDLTAQVAVANQAAGTPVPTSTPATAGTPVPQQVIVNNNQGFRGPSFVDDFLIWMWLSNSGFFRGPNVIINNPPTYAGRPSGDFYYSPPPATGSSPSTVTSSQAASRSTALEAARTSVSGQASGTGGGVAATNKSAADATARAGAATAKGAAAAGAVSAASAGKSISSAPSSSSSTASRSSGSTSAGSRGTAGTSSGGSSSGGKGISGSGGSTGFGGGKSSGGGASSSS
jgi:hypothetical protein